MCDDLKPPPFETHYPLAFSLGACGGDPTPPVADAGGDKEGKDAGGLGFIGLGWRLWNRVRTFVQQHGFKSWIPIGEAPGRPALDSQGPEYKQHEALLRKIHGVWYKHTRVAAGGAGIGVDIRVLTHSRRYVAAQCDTAGLCSAPTALKYP